MTKWMLTDIEMARAQGDKDACLAVLGCFGDCTGCSADCHCIAKAQAVKLLQYLIAITGKEGWPDSTGVKLESMLKELEALK